MYIYAFKYIKQTLPQLVASIEIVHWRGTAPENSWINIKFVKKSPKVIDLIWVWFIIYIKPTEAWHQEYVHHHSCVSYKGAVFVGGLRIKSTLWVFRSVQSTRPWICRTKNSQKIHTHVFHDKFLLDLNVYLPFEDDITAMNEAGTWILRAQPIRFTCGWLFFGWNSQCEFESTINDTHGGHERLPSLT